MESDILAGILGATGSIPQTIQDNNKKSLLNVSALTNELQAIVVSQLMDDSNNMSRK